MIPRTNVSSAPWWTRFQILELADVKNFTVVCGLLILAALCLPVSGCSKKPKPEANISAPVAARENAPSPVSQNAAANSRPAYSPISPQPLPPSSQAIAASASADAVAAQLTKELRRYVAYTRTIPKSFEDFIAHDPIKFPPPPAGKKYVIAGGQVVLQ